MSAHPILTLAAGAALLAAVVPVHARPLTETYGPISCFSCAPWHRAERDAVAAPYSQRVAALTDGRRRYTRFDIEGLRLLTRMP
ncbi:hypothetical protein FOHLNKBM_6015 [Methylobacterium longum]|nr:hypothetical protein FOHLNKBM_6015 [Methylobacterium longum]